MRNITLRILIMLFPVALHAENEKPKFSLTADLMIRDHRYVLNFKLQTSSSVVLYRSALPWETVHNLTLVAVTTSFSSEVLERSLEINDPGPQKLSLNPELSYSGRILLDDRFPDLKRTLMERPVLVFWNYLPEDVDGRKFERLGGWILIESPRGK